MGQDDWTAVAAIASAAGAVIQLFAVGVTLFGFLFLSRQIRLGTDVAAASRHDMADRYLLELNKLEFAQPELRDPSWIEQALTHHDPQVRLRYDVFATMVWNYAETLYDQYGEAKLQESSFVGVIRNFARRHRAWLSQHEESYNPAFIKWVDWLLPSVTTTPNQTLQQTPAA